MTAETALAGAAPGFASPAIREREPPDWLRAQKLTPARARELLADLESPCPGEDADAQRRHSDAQAKKFALLVFSMGAANAPAGDATPARSNEGSSPGGSKKEEDASDAFAAAVASCASHPDGDVRVLAADALVAIAERDPKAAAPHVDALVGLLRYPEDVSLALAALRRDTFPRLCRAALAAAATRRAAPSAHAHDAFDILAAALNARGDEAFAQNASALQLVDALGPEVVWRHADAVAAFVAPRPADGGVSDVVPKNVTNESSSNEALVPAHGFVLCELALRALRRSPEASTRFAADARRWADDGSPRVPESTRDAATSLVRFADARNAEIRRELSDMRYGSRALEGAEAVGGEGKRADAPAAKLANAGKSGGEKKSPGRLFYDVRPDTT
jgi:hypothetical protein